VATDNQRTLVPEIIQMAHKLGYKVVAEGVEYKEQLDMLHAHECDMVQGYYFSKPLEEEVAIAVAKKGNM
jgi:EAL domain-containing protein (putative c-di-GMP-specific phosphodiesterase class I)